MQHKEWVVVDDAKYVVHAIKEGGMGRVWLLENLFPDVGPMSLGRRIAVKTFEKAPNGFEFEAELNHWIGLHHPNILPLLKIGSLNYMTAAVMPWRHGTLADHLEQRPILAASEAIDVAVQISQATAFAYKNFGLVHLDLKPANVLLKGQSTNEIEVSDWGISRIAHQNNAIKEQQTAYGARGPTSFAAGTLLYMAPERLSGSWRLHPSADVFSIGQMLVEMLTGALPFRLSERPPHEELLSGQYMENARSLLADFPPRLKTIIQQCLAQQPAMRPDSSETLIRELRRCK